MTDKGMGNSVILNGKDGSKKPETVVGFDCAKYNQRKTTLARKKKQVAVIEEWIDDIPDGQTRCVFKMFYRDGMTWEKIAAKTGYCYKHSKAGNHRCRSLTPSTTLEPPLNP